MAKLEERKAELEKEFSVLNEEREKLVEQGKILNKRLSEIQAGQLRLQGQFAEVERLLKPPVADLVKDVKVKKFCAPPAAPVAPRGLA